MVDTIKPRSRVINSRDERYVGAWFDDLELVARIHDRELVAAVEEKAKDLLAQVDAHLELSSNLALDDA